MNIVNIAVLGDMQIFQEYLDLNIYQPNYYVSCIIFKNCNNNIKEIYYKKYYNNTIVIYSALDNGYDITRIYTIDQSNLTPDSLQYITENMIKTGRIQFDALIISNLSNVTLSSITLDNIKPDTYLEYSIGNAYVLNINPNMASIYLVNLYYYNEYDYKTLSLVIQHGRVIYNDMLLCEELLVLIKGIREYIPDWIPEITNNENNNISLDLLGELVDLGILRDTKVNINSAYIDEDVYDKFITYIDYITDSTILNAYLDGMLQLRDYIKPVEITYVPYDDSIKLLYELGHIYWSKIIYDLNHVFWRGLEIDSIHILRNILISLEQYNQVYNILITTELSLIDTILIYELLPMIDNIEIIYPDINITRSILDTNYAYNPYDPYDKKKLNYMLYKTGIRRIWKQYANDPNMVAFMCNYIPNVIPTLSPPISNIYYKFMDKDILSRLQGIKRIIEYSDVTIKTN